MKDKVRQKLNEYGLTEGLLTKEELLQLEKEIKAEAEGFTVLDGVLSNPDLFYRRKYYPKNVTV